MRQLWSLWWYSVLVMNLLVIGWFWWQGSGSLVRQAGPGAAIAFGRLAGLALAANVLLQFMLMGRMPWLERTFGLDRLARVHHLTGLLTIVFLVLHPLFLTWGYSQLNGVSLLAQFLDLIFDYQYVLWAGVGWCLFVIVVGTAITIVRKKWRYEMWYAMHLLVYLAVAASIWHQFSVGGDLLASRVFYLYWLGLYSFVLGSHVIFRFVRPLYLSRRHQFVVSRIERETDTVVSLYMTGRELDRFHISPGQFMILRFLTHDFWWQAHPFSLSRPADGRSLRVTIKELGDFTKRIHALPVGTRAMIEGPYGVFTETVSDSSRVLLIAGGIGITPIRSLLEAMLKRGRDVILLYGNRRQQEAVFTDELQQLAQQHGGTIIPVISDDPTFSGERGYIDAEKIERLVPDVTAREVYVCGPPAMIEAVVTILRSLGVPRAQIHFEEFKL